MISLIQTVVNRSEEPQYSAISPSRSFYSLEKTFSFGSSRSRTRCLGVLPVEQNEPYIEASFCAFGYTRQPFRQCLNATTPHSGMRTGRQAAASLSPKQTLLTNSNQNLKILEAIFLDVLPKEILYYKSFLSLIGNLHAGWAP